jgi:peptide/nickel transport system permease protein
MSDSEEFVPRHAEIVSSPGADVYMPNTDVPRTVSPPTTPAEIDLSGAVQVSERQQARRENWRLIRRRPGFIIGVLIVLVWTICALLGDRITPHSPLDFRTTPHLSPRSGFPFGTDEQGRDVLSRVMAGSRDVMKVAPIAALLGVFFGVIVGMLMGFFGGWLDNVVGRIVEAFLALPVVLLGLLAVTTLGTSSAVVIGVVAVLFTPVVARTVRSAVLAERDLDYVTSSKLRGESSPFVMFREILPNTSGPIIVELTVRVGYAVFTVATLSFLGAGPQPPSPDWGTQVSEAFRSISAGIWWTTVFPAAAIASLVIAANLIADSVQSVLEAS